MALMGEGVGTEPPLGYGRGVRPEKNPDSGGVSAIPSLESIPGAVPRNKPTREGLAWIYIKTRGKPAGNSFPVK